MAQAEAALEQAVAMAHAAESPIQEICALNELRMLQEKRAGASASSGAGTKELGERLRRCCGAVEATAEEVEEIFESSLWRSRGERARARMRAEREA